MRSGKRAAADADAPAAKKPRKPKQKKGSAESELFDQLRFLQAQAPKPLVGPDGKVVTEIRDYRKASWTLTNRGRTATGHGGIGDPLGTELPLEGRFSFKLRIDKVYKQTERISLGVCLATLTPHSRDDHTAAVEGSTSLAYMVSVPRGNLYMIGGTLPDDTPEEVKTKARGGYNPGAMGYPRLPPDGWPRLAPQCDATSVLVDEDGQATSLEGRAAGAVLEFCVDHDTHTLSIGLNGGPLHEAIVGFPPNVALRPYVRFDQRNDRVSLV
mmetsp:Transcript_31194/g.103239  ORF Transcript_31194/g.103239 Transcript_31194/m.103239 type:complete len:270 (+) Transcript_31194:41-850(+)